MTTARAEQRFAHDRVAQQILVPARSPEQSLVVVTTAEGSGSANTITLLARSAAVLS